mmetsp:Transcript_4686/g.5974  ORF Transcript_4686/g.5974 Transcript_4686/m.5974 type:complete len:381 (-) Transcript_4686:33-1175(-)
MAVASYATSAELPTDAELPKIGKLRAACEETIQRLGVQDLDVVGDLRLCRYLRATKGNVEQASTWFLGFLQWRSQTGIDVQRSEVIGLTPTEMLSWWRRVANPFVPFCPYAGRNVHGHVIWYLRAGLIDATRFARHRRVPMEEDLRVLHLLMEWTMWHLDMLSRSEERMVCVLKINDFRGIGAEGRTLPVMVPEFRRLLLEMVEDDKKFYCEHTAVFIAANTPFFFRAFFGLIRKALTQRQAAKISLLGDTSTTDVQRQLRGLIAEEYLPVEYGGQLVCAPHAFPVPSAEDVDAWYNSQAVDDLETGGAEMLRQQTAQSHASDSFKSVASTVSPASTELVPEAYSTPASEVQESSKHEDPPVHRRRCCLCFRRARLRPRS